MHVKRSGGVCWPYARGGPCCSSARRRRASAVLLLPSKVSTDVFAVHTVAQLPSAHDSACMLPRTLLLGAKRPRVGAQHSVLTAPCLEPLMNLPLPVAASCAACLPAPALLSGPALLSCAAAHSHGCARRFHYLCARQAARSGRALFGIGIYLVLCEEHGGEHRCVPCTVRGGARMPLAACPAHPLSLPPPSLQLARSARCSCSSAKASAQPA